MSSTSAAVAQLGRRAVGHDPAPVEDHDPVGEPLGLVQVVRRQHDGDAVVPQPGDELPHAAPARRRRRRPSARRGRPPRAGRRGPAPATAAAARRPTAAATRVRGPVGQADPLEQVVGVGGVGVVRGEQPHGLQRPGSPGTRRRPAASRRSAVAAHGRRRPGRGRAPAPTRTPGAGSPRSSRPSSSCRRRSARARRRSRRPRPRTTRRRRRRRSPKRTRRSDTTTAPTSIDVREPRRAARNHPATVARHARRAPAPHRPRRGARRAGPPRRLDPSTPWSTRRPSSTPASASLTQRRDELRARIKDLSRVVGQARARRRRGQGRGGAEPRAATSARPRRPSTPSTTRSPPPSATRCSASRTCRATTPPTAPARTTTSCSAPTASTPDAYADHQRVPHWDIGAELGILDLERAAKISGSMFTMYRGAGARLLRACVQLSLDRNADAYEEIRPPTLVLTDTMVVDRPPAEVRRRRLPHRARRPLGHPHRRGAAHVARTATRSSTRPTCRCGYCAHTQLLPARGGLGRAGHPRPAPGPRVRQGRAARRRRHRRAGDRLPGGRARPQRGAARRPRARLPRRSTCAPATSATPPPARWTSRSTRPGCDQWLEVSSVSWFTDYQARRANIRWRPRAADRKGTEICHTVNGSAMGWPRTVAAYLETHRRPTARSPSSRRCGPTSVAQALRSADDGAAVRKSASSIAAAQTASSNQTTLPRCAARRPTRRRTAPRSAGPGRGGWSAR